MAPRAVTLVCRQCGVAMARVRRGSAHFWKCETCGAHALSETTLRKLLPPGAWATVWPAIRVAAAPGTKRCPACDCAMEETREIHDARSLRLDYCDRCRLIWLDPTELATMPKVPVTETPGLPPELRRRLAEAVAQAISAEYDAREEGVFAPLREFAVAFVWGLLRAFLRRR